MSDSQPDCCHHADEVDSQRRSLLSSLAAAPLAGAALMAPCSITRAAPPLEERSKGDIQQIKKRLTALTRQSGAPVARIETFTLEPHHLPWSQQLGVLEAGQQVTFFLQGRWWFSRADGRWLERMPRGWDQVETHVVQRSGTDRLGQEMTEQVDVYEAYQRIIGGSASRVVHVWLIANSLFMRGYGRCTYRDIRLGKPGRQQQII